MSRNLGAVLALVLPILTAASLHAASNRYPRVIPRRLFSPCSETYATVQESTGNRVPLTWDVYFNPATRTPKPVVLLIHTGSFKELGIATKAASSAWPKTWRIADTLPAPSITDWI